MLKNTFSAVSKGNVFLSKNIRPRMLELGTAMKQNLLVSWTQFFFSFFVDIYLEASSWLRMICRKRTLLWETDLSIYLSVSIHAQTIIKKMIFSMWWWFYKPTFIESINIFHSMRILHYPFSLTLNFFKGYSHDFICKIVYLKVRVALQFFIETQNAFFEMLE